MPYDLRSPVTEQQLAELDDRPECIQFCSALTDAEYQLLGEWFHQQPNKTLRAYGSYDRSITDLDFLRHFPSVRSFMADALYDLGSIDGLRYLPDDVRFIGLGQTKRRLSLRPLKRFTSLERLYLEGQTIDIGVIGTLVNLHSLTLRSITLKDLSLLVPLRELRALELHLGGTTDLRLLKEIARLEYLGLWMVRGLIDLSPIEELRCLEYLSLQSLRRVENLPNMSHLVGLRRLWIENMRGVTDLSPIRDAPHLRQLAVVEMRHLEPEDFRPLAGKPTLVSFRAGLGSRRKNEALNRLIQLSSSGNWKKPHFA